MLHVTYMLVVIFYSTMLLHTCYVTVTLLSRKLQLTYMLHVILYLLGIVWIRTIHNKMTSKNASQLEFSSVLKKISRNNDFLMIFLLKINFRRNTNLKMVTVIVTCVAVSSSHTGVVFGYTLPVLKIYSIHNVNYRFLVLVYI